VWPRFKPMPGSGLCIPVTSTPCAPVPRNPRLSVVREQASSPEFRWKTMEAAQPPKESSLKHSGHVNSVPRRSAASAQPQLQAPGKRDLDAHASLNVLSTAPAASPRQAALLRRIRLSECVRARRYATTARIGLGLHRTARAALRSTGSSRDSTKGLTGSSCGPDLVGPGRLTCYAIGTTASADPRGISLPVYHHWDGSPGKVIRHSTRRAMRPFGGAGPSTARCAGGLGSGRLLTDQAEQWTHDAILQRVV
jgi:hypothetical protein